MAEIKAEYGLIFTSVDDLLKAIESAVRDEAVKQVQSMKPDEKVRITEVTKGKLCKNYLILNPNWIDAVVEEQMNAFATGKCTEALTEENLYERAVEQIADVLYDRFCDYFDYMGLID